MPNTRNHLHEAALESLLGYRLAQAAVVTSKNFRARVGKPLGWSQIEFTLLQLVKQNSDVGMTKLARALAISLPALTAIADKLVAKGLLTRSRSAQDGRSLHLALTPDADVQLGDATDALLKADELSFAPLSSAERAMLLELLAKASRCEAV